MPTRYFISIPDGALARGDDAELSFRSTVPMASLPNCKTR